MRYLKHVHKTLRTSFHSVSHSFCLVNRMNFHHSTTDSNNLLHESNTKPNPTTPEVSVQLPKQAKDTAYSCRVESTQRVANTIIIILLMRKKKKREGIGREGISESFFLELIFIIFSQVSILRRFHCTRRKTDVKAQSHQLLVNLQCKRNKNNTHTHKNPFTQWHGE